MGETVPCIKNKMYRNRNLAFVSSFINKEFVDMGMTNSWTQRVKRFNIYVYHGVVFLQILITETWSTVNSSSIDMYWIGLFCELFQTAIQVAQKANLHIANQWEENKRMLLKKALTN